MENTAAFIRTHRHDHVPTLALQLSGKDGAEFILRQIEGYQRLRQKVPSWTQLEELHYPVRLSLEQCSSEATAQYKVSLAQRLCGDILGPRTLVDLTGGFGVDFAFLAPLFQRAIYVEQNEELCRLARHNFPLLGISHAEIVSQEATDFVQTMPTVHLVYLDPARRDNHGRKVAALNQCSPDVTAIWSLLCSKSQHVMLKMSPMFDVHEVIRVLQHVAELHIVGSRGECKELLVVSGATSEPCVYCHDDHIPFSFCLSEAAGVFVELAEDVGKYLYDPSAVILKAHADRLVAQRLQLQAVSSRSRLYTSDVLIPDFPGRIFEVQSVTSCSKRDVARWHHRVANLAVRGFPIGAEALRKSWHLTDGGDTFLFATTDAQNKKLLIESKKISKKL